jgi:hypothetical protein
MMKTSPARLVARGVRLFSLKDFHGSSVSDESQTRFYFEDGWVFREHHGRFVECICRFEDIHVANLFQPGYGQEPANDRARA